MRSTTLSAARLTQQTTREGSDEVQRSAVITVQEIRLEWTDVGIDAVIDTDTALTLTIFLQCFYVGFLVPLCRKW